MTEPRAPEPAIEEQTVLLAEDDEDLGESTALLLESFGYRVVRARDGQEAIDALADALPDVVLLDIMMPRVDGLGVLRALGGLARRPVVIAISAYPGYLQAAGRAGADYLLGKPFGVEDLRDVLARALTRH